MVGGRVTDHLDRDGRAGHPRQHVPWRQAEVDHHGPGLARGLAAVVSADHDGPHAPGGVALEADRRRGHGHDRLEQGHAGGAQPVRRPRGQDPGQAISGADRLELRGPSRDHDLVRLDVEHPRRRPRDDGRPGVDAGHLDAVARVEDQGVVALAGGRAAGRPAADDHGPDRAPFDGHVRAPRVDEERRVPVDGMPRHDGTRPSGRLACPHERDAIDDREAVPAVAGEAERPAATRLLAGTQDRDRERVARVGLDRPAIDDDPRGAAARRLGHWRIRTPWGSNSGSGWSRAGRRRPMISISKRPPVPFGDARATGTYPSAIDALT